MRSLYINMWPDVYPLDAPFVCQVQGGLESLLTILLRCIILSKFLAHVIKTFRRGRITNGADFRVENRKKGSLSSFIILGA